MLSVLRFALLDCETILSNLHRCERRRPRSGVSSAALPPLPPPLALAGIMRAVALERDLRSLGFPPQLGPEKKKRLLLQTCAAEMQQRKNTPIQHGSAGARARSCRHVRAPGKDSEKDGESKRRIDSARVQRRYVSASDREDSPPGRSQPFSTKNDT